MKRDERTEGRKKGSGRKDGWMVRANSEHRGVFICGWCGVILSAANSGAHSHVSIYGTRAFGYDIMMRDARG